MKFLYFKLCPSNYCQPANVAVCMPTSMCFKYVFQIHVIAILPSTANAADICELLMSGARVKCRLVIRCK